MRMRDVGAPQTATIRLVSKHGCVWMHWSGLVAQYLLPPHLQQVAQACVSSSICSSMAP